MGARQIRSFPVNPTNQEGPPLCFGIGGPPGSGKTVSALRIGAGMGRVRGGKPALIDTEAGRALKYMIGPQNPNGFDFDYIPFAPPFKPESFMDAINAAAKLNPSAIIVDNASDEHEGPGGVLDWHDQNVESVGGNEWAAWNKPKASRRILTAGVQQIRIPIIMTFRARPKTVTQKNYKGKEVPVKIGFVPIAGDELLGVMDLFCLLPPKSNGVAVWSSTLAGEDFAIKIPYFLARYIEQGAVLSEDLGETLALWQAGKVDASGAVIRSGTAAKRSPEEMTDSFIAGINATEDLDDLREYQTLQARVDWVAKLKAARPDLYDRIIEAQSRKFAALKPADEFITGGDDDQFPAKDDDSQ